jgi:hypothetical protein
MTRTIRCSVRRCRPWLAGALADLGDFGFMEFVADEATKLVRVYHLVWTG